MPNCQWATTYNGITGNALDMCEYDFIPCSEMQQNQKGCRHHIFETWGEYRWFSPEGDVGNNEKENLKIMGKREHSEIHERKQ